MRQARAHGLQPSRYRSQLSEFWQLQLAQPYQSGQRILWRIQAGCRLSEGASTGNVFDHGCRFALFALGRLQAGAPVELWTPGFDMPPRKTAP